ncbi:MAG: hypothetical protein IJ503_02205 [Akkermansia sp.]|nr:hypothetical protein [Akkermansia sp.]
MYPLLCTKVLRTALQLSCGAVLLTAGACNHRPPAAPAEQPPLMAGEARFRPMSKEEKIELQHALEPFVKADSPVELWYSAAKRKDDGSFEWCISPAPAEAEWVNLGSLPAAELSKLAAETTATDFGETLDYWLRLELRSGTHRLNLSICPAAEFGVPTGDCSMSVYSRPFHKTLWALIDKKYNIQKRFDKVVHM